MQLSKFVTPAYFSVNSLFFFHSFANSNFVGWCILALLKHHKYTDGPACHNKPKHCHRILEIFIYFFNLLEKCLKWPSWLSLSLSVKTAIFTRLKSLLKPRDKSCSARHKSHCQKKASLSPSLSICGPLALSLLALVSQFLSVSYEERADKTGGAVCKRMQHKIA